MKKFVKPTIRTHDHNYDVIKIKREKNYFVLTTPKSGEIRIKKFNMVRLAKWILDELPSD